MKMSILRLIAVVSVALFALSCTEREWAAMQGMDIDAPISITLSGTSRDYAYEYVTSSTGRYVKEDHPQITLHDDGTFSFELRRALVDESGRKVQLCFEWDRHKAGFDIDRVYSLYVIRDARAELSISDWSAAGELVTTTYKAANGYIKFTNRRPYSGSFLFSGEFKFEGRDEEGNKAWVENGRFENCRICWGDDYGCSAY